MGEVPSPRAVTYRTTCHQWFCIGASASRVLPTICVQRCRVVWVVDHSSSVSRGHIVSVLSMIYPPHTNVLRLSMLNCGDQRTTERIMRTTLPTRQLGTTD